MCRTTFILKISSSPKRRSKLRSPPPSKEPLTLIIHADKSVTYSELAHLALLAREPAIGITNLVLATLPQLAGTTNQP